MTRILFKFIIYPSCERALKNGRVKSKIVRKSSFVDMIFLTLHDYICLLFICFLYCAKEGIAVKILKVSQPIVKSLSLCKGGRKCKNKFFNQSLLHPVDFQKRKLQIFVSSFISCSLQWPGWLNNECVWISALKYCQYHTVHLLNFQKRP